MSQQNEVVDQKYGDFPELNDLIGQSTQELLLTFKKIGFKFPSDDYHTNAIVNYSYKKCIFVIGKKYLLQFGNNETFYVLKRPMDMSDDDIVNTYQFGNDFHLHNPVGAGMVVWSFGMISEYYCLDGITITKKEFIKSKLKRRIEHINEI